MYSFQFYLDIKVRVVLDSARTWHGQDVLTFSFRFFKGKKLTAQKSGYFFLKRRVARIKRFPGKWFGKVRSIQS
jgi:hypothetical protein